MRSYYISNVEKESPFNGPWKIIFFVEKCPKTEVHKDLSWTMDDCVQRFTSLSTAILPSISFDFPNEPKFLEKYMKCLSLFFIITTRRLKWIILEYAGGKSCKSPRNVWRGSMHHASLQSPGVEKPNLYHFNIGRKTKKYLHSRWAVKPPSRS